MKGALPALVCVSSHLSPLHYTPSYHLPELVIGRGAGIREDRRDIDCCRNIFLEQAFACCQLGGRCCVWRRPYPGFVIASIRSFLMPLISCIIFGICKVYFFLLALYNDNWKRPVLKGSKHVVIDKFQKLFLTLKSSQIAPSIRICILIVSFVSHIIEQHWGWYSWVEFDQSASWTWLSRNPLWWSALVN